MFRCQKCKKWLKNIDYAECENEEASASQLIL